MNSVALLGCVQLLPYCEGIVDVPDEVKYSWTRLGDIQIGPTEVLEVDDFAWRRVGLLEIVESRNSFDDRL